MLASDYYYSTSKPPEGWDTLLRGLPCFTAVKYGQGRSSEMPHSKDLGTSVLLIAFDRDEPPYSFTVSVSNFLGKHTLPKHVVHMDLTDSCRNLELKSRL